MLIVIAASIILSYPQGVNCYFHQILVVLFLSDLLLLPIFIKSYLVL